MLLLQIQPRNVECFFLESTSTPWTFDLFTHLPVRTAPEDFHLLSQRNQNPSTVTHPSTAFVTLQAAQIWIKHRGKVLNEWGKTLQLKTSEPLAHPRRSCYCLHSVKIRHLTAARWPAGITDEPEVHRQTSDAFACSTKRLRNDRRQSNPPELTEMVCFAPNRSTTDSTWYWN